MIKEIVASCMLILFGSVDYHHSGKPAGNLTGEITVVISGLKSDKGTIKIGLFSSEASWNNQEKKYAGASLVIKNCKTMWVVKDVPYGQYAIKFFHDENNDDKLNTNFLGMPKETYGFYLQGQNRFVPPTFNDAKFNLQTAKLIVEVRN
ncbi:MAG: DUF2141 domain-containing protein [Bacteroidales bacterium]|nr:DUF2141 domain-containing protein [Bacteroidales bacterium]